MIELEGTDRERCIIVGVSTRAVGRSVTEEYLNELALLADTAGADVVAGMSQDRDRIDSATFIGKGKVEEIHKLIVEQTIPLVIFDDDLSAVQVRNLERILECKVLDRSGLILDIFASRAKSNEAKTQVELAQLQDLLPRLTRQWTHLSKQFGGIGTKGPGETQIETDRRMIRSRISHLKEKLERISQQRSTQRKGRLHHTRAACGVHERREVHAVEPALRFRRVRREQAVCHVGSDNAPRSAQPIHSNADDGYGWVHSQAPPSSCCFVQEHAGRGDGGGPSSACGRRLQFDV